MKQNSSRDCGSLCLVAGLLVCVVTGVLAFGGTEPFFWSVVELGTFLLFGLVLWSSRAQSPATLPWKGAAVLLGYIALQTALLRPEVHAAEEQFVRLAAYLCAFYAALFACRNAKSRGRLVLGLVALGVLEALYGLVQYVSGWQQIFTYSKVHYTAQATGTYINPNHFAGLLEMILPLALVLAVERLESAHTAHPQKLASHLLRGEAVAAVAFFSFAALLILAAILFSRSRAGLASTAVSLAALATAWTVLMWRRFPTMVATACLLAATLAFALWIGLDPVEQRFRDLSVDYSTRLSVWKDAFVLIERHPLRGVGLGSFGDAFTRVQSTFPSLTVDHAHNDYLEVAAEWGLAGAGLLFGLIAVLLSRIVSACQRLLQPELRLLYLASCAGIVALLLHSAADFNLQIPANGLVFAVLLGLGYSSLYSPSISTCAGGEP